MSEKIKMEHETTEGDLESGHQNASERPSDGAELPALPKIISFDSLSRCGDEIWIENGGQIYRLRRTRQGKLILTK